MPVPKYLLLSVWRESTSSSLRSVCQQRAIGLGERQGTQRRRWAQHRKGPTRTWAEKPQHQQRVSVPAFSSISCQDSHLPFIRWPLRCYLPKIIFPPATFPDLVLVFSVAQTTICDYLIHLPPTRQERKGPGLAHCHLVSPAPTQWVF